MQAVHGKDAAYRLGLVIQPDREKTVTTKQVSQKESHDKHTCARELDIGETVMDYNPKNCTCKQYCEEMSRGVWVNLLKLNHQQTIETEPSINNSPDDDIDLLPTLPDEFDGSAEGNDTSIEATYFD